MRIEWFFIWTNLSPHHPSSLCAKIGWNWPSGSGEEIFLNFVNVFSLFHKHLPLEISGVLHLNKLEFPLPKDALCHVWLKLGQWFWWRIRKCEKFTTTMTDDEHIVIRKAHLSLQLRWVKIENSHSLNIILISKFTNCNRIYCLTNFTTCPNVKHLNSAILWYMYLIVKTLFFRFFSFSLGTLYGLTIKVNVDRTFKVCQFWRNPNKYCIIMSQLICRL